MWFIGSVAGIVGLLVVLVALAVDAPEPQAPQPTLPPGLPRPAQVRTPPFPLAWRGYDPRVVDAHLREVAERYEALYLAAGPSVLARAEAVLDGEPEPEPEPEPAPTEPDATSAVADGPGHGDAPPPPDEPGDDGARPGMWD